MKVKANNLFYNFLPSKKDKKKLLAEDGMGVPGDPRVKNMVKTLPDDYFNVFGDPKKATLPGLADTKGGAPNVQLPNQHPQQIDPNTYNPGIRPQTQLPRRNPNVGNAILLGLEAVDAAIPGERIHNQQVVHPQQGYAPHPLGTGSSALMDDGGWMMNPARDTPLVIPEGVADNTPGAMVGYHLMPGSTGMMADREHQMAHIGAHLMEEAKSGNWIQGAVNPKHKGYCTPMTKSTCTPRRKAFAKTMKKHHGFHKKAEGGELPVGPIKQLPPRSVAHPQDPRYLFSGIQAPYSQPDSAQYSQAYSAALRGTPNYHNFANPAQGMRQSKIARNAILDALTTHEGGGIIPDNMSNFSPHEYEAGGFLEHIMYHPNQQDMMGWAEAGRPIPMGPTLFDLRKKPIKKAYGGSVRGGSDTPDMLENIFFHPNAADMQGFANGGSMRGGSDTMNILEQIVMHPNMQDMAGWDKAKSGKSLSPAKAREMLHDKTAHGYKLTDKQRKYFGAVASGYAASGIGIGPGDPPPTPKVKSPQEQYYESSAELAYYKNKLNEKLKAKNPQAFGDYFKGLSDLRRSGKTQDASKYVQTSQYNDYLSPDEVKKTLGDSDYSKYLDSLKNVNTYDVQQGQQPLYGTEEGNNDLTKLNYGRRFASLQLTPSVGVHSTGGKDYSRNYTYDPSKGVSYTESGDPSLKPSYLKNGGLVYADGGEVDTMWGGDVEQISGNPHDGGTMQFNGKSHEDGGIGMHYNGNPVEVEGGETASRDQQGNLNIYGNMYLPGTRTKFKTVAKEIADKEKRYDFLKTRGSELVNNSNPANKFDRLAFNAGKVMMSGGAVGQKDLAEKKYNLAALQRAMLDTASEHGIDAQHMSAGKVRKAKGGASIPFAAAGDSIDPNEPGRSTRNNNPGNIKYGKWAKQHGATGQDKDGFAIFPDRNVGAVAMQNLLKSPKYSGKTVSSAIKEWTGGKPYKHDFGGLENKKVSDLSPEEFDSVVSGMTYGEDTRYGATPPSRRTPSGPPPTAPRYGIPNIPLTPDATKPRPGKVTPPELDHITPPGPRNLPSNVEGLQAEEILPELYAAATNKVEPVAMQNYNPQLYQPYQVSFQDRLNQNQATYNALQRTIGSTNPTALGEIAAQKYAADSGVKGEEFRTNQAISDDITNKNIALRNDAQMKNLGLADTQYVRQATAKSKTKELNQMILNSISSKYLQNQLENKRLAAYENLYDYRFTPGEQGGLNATYFGPNASFNFNNNPSQQGRNADVRTVSRFDAQGNPKGYTTYDENRLKEQNEAMELEMRRRKLPLLSTPPLQ